MLNELPEELFRELIHFDNDNPEEDAYINTARICTVIYNRFEDVMVMMAGGKTNYAKMTDYLPRTRRYETDETTEREQHPGMDDAEDATRRIAERRSEYEAKQKVSANGD